jgi:outer membrane protein TolC
VLLAVAQAYYAAAGTEELSQARADAVTVATQTLRDARARAQAGAATNVEVLRAEVALERATQDQTETDDTRAQASRALSTLLGTREPVRARPVSGAPAPEGLAGPEVRVTQQPGAAPAPGAAEAARPADLGAAPGAELVKQALRARPELRSTQLALEAAEERERAALWRWAPALSGFGNLQAANSLGFSGDAYAWAVGVQLDWQLYDGGLRDAQRRAARAQQLEAAARLELQRDTVADEVATDRRALDTRRRALDSATRSVQLSREALRLVRAQYESGKATQLDLLQAQDSLVLAQVAAAQARFGLALAALQLRRDTGQPLRPSSTDVPEVSP